MTKTSHSQLLRSTTIIGGSSALNVLFRIVQAKVAATLLGPTGVGLLSLFNSTTGLAGSIAGMGLDSSGVRQIAEAVAAGDADRAAQTVAVYRRLNWLFAVAGTLLFFALRVPIARLTFGNTEYVSAMGVLGLVIFFTVIAGAQFALIRGVRRVGDLARAYIFGAAAGTVLGLPVLYFWRMPGVAPYLIIIAGTTLLASWWYARKIPVARVSVSWAEMLRDGRPMLSLGVSFMTAGLVTAAGTYLVKILVQRGLGLEASGLYEAAGALSNVYVGFILGAMGADFYPHLTSVAHDRVASSELMNAQIEVGLLAALPGILALLALGPLALRLLYSSSFVAAFEILRWQALGTFLRVVSWPLGYLMLAKGKGSWFFGTELITNLVYLAAVAIGVKFLGIAGIGLAFFAEYIFYTILMILVARALSGFAFSSRNARLALTITPAVLAAFLCSWSPSVVITVLAVLLTGAAAAYSLLSLVRLTGAGSVRTWPQRFRERFEKTDRRLPYANR